MPISNCARLAEFSSDFTRLNGLTSPHSRGSERTPLEQARLIPPKRRQYEFHLNRCRKCFRRTVYIETTVSQVSTQHDGKLVQKLDIQCITTVDCPQSEAQEDAPDGQAAKALPVTPGNERNCYYDRLQLDRDSQCKQKSCDILMPRYIKAQGDCQEKRKED